MRRVVGWRLAVPLVCLLTGVLFTATRHAAAGYDLRGGRTNELSSLVHDAETRVAQAQDRLTRLRAEAESLEPSAAGSDFRLRAARDDADALAAVAGLTALTGEGVTVTLSDAPRNADGRYPDDVDPDALVVHQQDIQGVLNALWAGGAEAVTVADQRMLTTSAVRCIGNTLLLHGRTYSPPYRISAIGDQDRMLAALAVEPAVAVFRQYVHRYGLGYQVQRLGTVEVPAFTGSPRLSSVQEVLR